MLFNSCICSFIYPARTVSAMAAYWRFNRVNFQPQIAELCIIFCHGLASHPVINLLLTQVVTLGGCEASKTGHKSFPNNFEIFLARHKNCKLMRDRFLKPCLNCRATNIPCLLFFRVHLWTGKSTIYEAPFVLDIK